jgi:Secretion system C-terminal sorting domain
MVKDSFIINIKSQSMKKSYSLSVSIFLLTYGFAIAQPTQPANPAAGNSNNCTTTAAILTCPPNSSGVQTSFTGGSWNRGGGASSNLNVGAIWRFSNITTVAGNQVNAEVKVDAASNAALTNMDNNSGGVTPAFFAPEISPTTTGNNSRAGYVQFTISFFDNTSGGFSHAQDLVNLNFVHLDIDGNGNSSAWFRETGVALTSSATNPTIIANAGTELVAYSYADNTTTPGGSWRGFAGSVFERDGVSTCAEVAVAYRYTGNKNSVTFRMGYDFKGTGDPATTARQYGATFGCFAFPAESPLPIKLLSFSGVYRSQQTLLNWSSESEQNFAKYEIERSSNGIDFQFAGEKPARGSMSKSDYTFNDDLGLVSGNVFYYRLKMIDIDTKAKYSSVIMIRKDTKAINGITLNPNPVIRGGIATIRFTAAVSNRPVDFRVSDMTGKVVLKQQNEIYEGNNSISINNLDRLQPGMYVLQMADGDTVITTKFSVIR